VRLIDPSGKKWDVSDPSEIRQAVGAHGWKIDSTNANPSMTQGSAPADTSNPFPATSPTGIEAAHIKNQSLRDLLNFGPMAGMMVGGGLGAMTGPAAPIVSPLLAGLGGAGMEMVRQGLTPMTYGARAGSSPMDLGSVATQGAIGAGSELAGMGLNAGLRGMGARLDLAAVKPSEKLLKDFPNAMADLGKSGLPPGSAGRIKAIQAVAKSGGKTANLLSQADRSGWTTTADALLPDVESLVPARTHGRGDIIAMLREEADQFLKENPGPLKPSDVKDIKVAHFNEAPTALAAQAADKNVARAAPYVEQLHKGISDNALASLESIGGTAGIPTRASAGTLGQKIAASEKATQAAMGARDALARINMAQAKGGRAMVNLRPPFVPLPSAIVPSVGMSPAVARRLALLMQSPITHGITQQVPRLMSPMALPPQQP
jgi:hypothetical protein